MNKTVITDDATFWSLLEAGAGVYYQVKRGDAGKRVPSWLYLARRESASWRNRFSTDDLPCGRYYVLTE